MSVGPYIWDRESKKDTQDRLPKAGEQRDTYRAQTIGDAGGALALHEGH